MPTRLRYLSALSLALALAGPPAASADEPKTNPVPLTREDVKQALEKSKHSTSHLPLPPLTEEQKARAEETAKNRDATRDNSGRGGLGGSIVNNGRMRSYYLSEYNLPGQGQEQGRAQGQGQGQGQR